MAFLTASLITQYKITIPTIKERKLKNNPIIGVNASNLILKHTPVKKVDVKNKHIVYYNKSTLEKDVH